MSILENAQAYTLTTEHVRSCCLLVTDPSHVRVTCLDLWVPAHGSHSGVPEADGFGEVTGGPHAAPAVIGVRAEGFRVLPFRTEGEALKSLWEKLGKACSGGAEAILGLPPLSVPGSPPAHSSCWHCSPEPPNPSAQLSSPD